MDSLADLARAARRAQENQQRAAEAPSPVEKSPEHKDSTNAASEPRAADAAPPTTTQALPVLPPLIQDLRLGSAPPSGSLPLPPQPTAPTKSRVEHVEPADATRAPDPATDSSNSSSNMSAAFTPPPKIAVPPSGKPVDISPEYRPMTSSTKRLSFTSLTSSKRPIKFGRGKHAHTELSPQPSDDPDDPLNWPLWKKDLNLAALLTTVALIQVMKTVFVTVNVTLEQSFNRSYTAIAALTGAPLIFSAITGAAALVASRVYGKRPIYLAGTALVFFGSIWNAAIGDEYGQALAARIFQGMGWGVFDSLVLGSIHDTFFEHERGLRIAIYQMVSVGTLWGGPLLGGVASQNPASWRTQFQILCGFQAASVLLVALAVPETAFHRSFVFLNTPSTAGSMRKQPLRPRGQMDVEKAKEYLKTMKPASYKAQDTTSTLLLQAPRAMVAPTTVMTALASFLPFSALWAIASSLSLLFAHVPFNKTPSEIGSLMAGPFILGVAVTAFFALVPFWQRIKSCARIGLIALSTGSVMSFVAVLTMGLYTEAIMMTPEAGAVAPAASDALRAAAASRASPFMVGGVASNLSFPALGFLLGMLATGAYTLDATVRPIIHRSTSFTSSNLGVALRNTVDMEGAVSLWRTLTAGAFVIGMPNLLWSFSAMRAALVGIAISQLVILCALGAIWWMYDEAIIRLDGRIMKLVDLSSLKPMGSYLDVD